MYVLGKSPTPGLSSGERAILLTYAAHADVMTGRNAWPSDATIAVIVGVRRERVLRVRHKLARLGYLLPDGYGPPPLVDGYPREDRRSCAYIVAIEPFRARGDDDDGEVK
jgi:hypothetical protein